MLLFCHQISTFGYLTVCCIFLNILLVEQYLGKFEFDGVTFQPYGFEAPVNFGNVELPPAPKAAVVKPKQRVTSQPEPPVPDPPVVIPQPTVISCSKCDKLDVTLLHLQK